MGGVLRSAQSFQCPVPIDQEAGVTLAQGEGGRASRDFLRRHIVSRFPRLQASGLNDGACLPTSSGTWVLATDSFVVSPLFFPGGDIGKLAVVGTANDLAMMGARPQWLSLALIIEEAFSLATLDSILDSVAATAEELGVEVVTGDTKVVPRGCADGLFINTSGMGLLMNECANDSRALVPGDVLIVTGPIGQHGMAVMAAREQLGVLGELVSDCGSLWPAVQSLHEAKVPYRALRDATRGGVAAVLHEWAGDCHQTLQIEERSIPVTAAVRGLSEMLGMDPLFVANEGTMVVAVPEDAVQLALDALRQVPISRGAQVIGHVQKRDIAAVTIVRALGRPIPLDEPQGAHLPRIC